MTLYDLFPHVGIEDESEDPGDLEADEVMEASFEHGEDLRLADESGYYADGDYEW